MSNLERLLLELSIHRRFAVDILSVAKGLRLMGLIHVPVEVEKELKGVLSWVGLRVCAQRVLVRSDDPDSREGILREGQAAETGNFVELWYSRQDSVDLPPAATLYGNPGKHLGYPPCCVAEWAKLQSQRDFYQRYLLDTRSGYWEINRLATFFQDGLLIPDFYPCSMSCEEARRFAGPIRELAREHLDASWVEQTVRWMQAPLLQHSGYLYAFPKWTLAGQTLEMMSDEARRVQLLAVGRFDKAAQQGTRLVAFGHLEDALEAVLVSTDQSRVRVSLVDGGR